MKITTKELRNGTIIVRNAQVGDIVRVDTISEQMIY